MGTLLNFIPALVRTGPAVISLVTGIFHMVHAEEAATAGSATPKPGAEKKASVLSKFEEAAAPFVAPLISSLVGHQIDAAALVPAISALIDAIVALNNALGIFQPGAKPAA